MAISTLYSAKRIEQQFHTGEEPVMVMCSDVNIYVCKSNNANLMYDMAREQLVSIDYGCIFNTATFEYPLSQLTSTDTILWSDLFRHLLQGTDQQTVLSIVNRLKIDYNDCIARSGLMTTEIVSEMPQEWKVSTETVEEKLAQLFDEQWIVTIWNNFINCLNENIG